MDMRTTSRTYRYQALADAIEILDFMRERRVWIFPKQIAEFMEWEQNEANLKRIRRILHALKRVRKVEIQYDDKVLHGKAIR